MIVRAASCLTTSRFNQRSTPNHISHFLSAIPSGMATSNLQGTINGRYEICRHIGSSSFGMWWVLSWILPVSIYMFLGKIYAGYDTVSGEDIAIKFEPQSSKHLHLENEYNIYKSLGNHIGIPRLKWFGQEHNQRVLVLSLLGSSLENIFVASGCCFKLKTVLAIANQMVCSVCFYKCMLIFST